MDANLDCLRVLFLEDSESDIELIYQKLAGDFPCPVDMATASGEAEFHACLESGVYDLILADYTLPGYDAPAALALVRRLHPDIPFICVSGMIGEDVAVELLKQGAADYVLKDRLSRLSFAVLRALEGARADREKRNAEDEARMRLETEARYSVLTEFFTNVSHEMKTPLSLILMQLDMMRVHMGNTGKMKDLMSDATLNAYRLTRLVRNLLDITKMDAGFLKLNLRNRDIVLLLRHITDSVREYACARKISLEFVCSAGAKRMALDSDKTERAVINLLSNAIKHTPEGGRITLELKDAQDRVMIRVADTGDGIPQDKLAIVFDRFAQVSNRMNRQTEGCGIGLALVKSMAELHGGRVWAESAVGQGSVFTLELPVRHAGNPDKSVVIEGFDLSKKVRMELSDLYIRMES